MVRDTHSKTQFHFFAALASAVRLDVIDETGRVTGKLSVRARWRKPLKAGGARVLGPNALTATETEDLMSRFSPRRDCQVRNSSLIASFTATAFWT